MYMYLIICLVIKVFVWVLMYLFMFQGIYPGVKVSRLFVLSFWA